MSRRGTDRTGRGRRTAALASLGLVAGLVTAATVPAAGSVVDLPDKGASYTPRLVAPDTPNPHLAFLADGTGADVVGWNLFLNAAGRERASREAPGSPRTGLRVAEAEPAGASSNDTQADAEVIARFGTSRGGVPAAAITGSGTEGVTGTTTPFVMEELDGSIDTATEVPPLALGDAATSSGVIGDEPAPGGDPDFDFLSLPGLTAGQVLEVDLDTPFPFEDLDPFVALWNLDLAPVEIAVNDDDGETFDSRLVVTIPVDGDYHVSIGGFGAFVPVDPTDPASPSVTGAEGSEGAYDVTVALVPPPDRDWYAFDLDAGDIVGASADGGATRVELHAEDGTLLIGSSQDVTFIHPEVSPLPGGGNAAASYVVEEAGRYALAVEALGPYTADLQAFRPAKERAGNQTQTLFLDFDGASLDPGIFFGGPFGFEVELSPLSAYLEAWGLDAGDEDAVIDAIVASVEESFRTDVHAFGNNDTGATAFDVEILNSRDHADPFGERFVSRVIVGGDIEELGIATLGIAQSIDVGDFEGEEDSVVLLDLLAGVGPFPLPPADLKNFPLAPGTSIVDLIGVAVGNIAAHEAGHFSSNWHTDQFNDAANIQDQGGNLPGFIGIGDDGVFGTADDVDVDFGKDVYNPNEGFAGIEDTLQSLSFSLSTGPGRGGR